ncbi:polyhydroxyalkanoate synthase protein [Halorhabdus tiamatea SARL4B]|uniref:Polyhydroxyalkanoate synthase protein n=1 Tax=Halorhabdus tiamatea SARL4B TaxID=1033806 RepID=F7PFH3_9EURY|nr:helix-hairpin-helix domain-containing protein [Halorhabdus tiamatea]ERJ06469.1 polyhydroxyalkanoate synthase protein [Halorhabdus tiamatea SARL4B]CCQ34366.1 hypothetical protein containing DNA repair Rad51 / transcription factor NusA, alpha-helical domain [Halorhabdus tiamatea SARL4B]
MALFDQIKELLGLGSGGSSAGTSEQGPGSRDDVAVTVEHEPDTESEDAVKGTGPEPTSETAGDTSSAGATTDGEADTEADVTTDREADTEADATESTEGDGDESEDTTKTASSGEPAAETAETEAHTDEAAETSASEPASASTEDVQSINGIGPAYAERLAEADVETVGDLATADADAVAETTGIALSRVEGWIEQASE